ncbi:hypothetical protein BST81_08775 [Leptolyngbya sp. 'hensonii']|uniref:hypothetical protein n=1 Tax=Leptolyngbya sp. 'hensonii' TaxID=1922337 RepID=UPI00094FC007|nr:hypothetical protein [Leptolyngbya sp. 'hensonii']OLP18819.1 hypothetical protein BST81_08775 [Leptolyngbya sp. 'hensonii']
MSNRPHLTSESTLGDLPLLDFQVHPATLGQVIAQRFKQRSDLPGVIVADGAQLVGVISRRRFLEYVGEQHRRESILRKPIQALCEEVGALVKPLQLLATEKVNVAVRLGLGRAPENAYEPIVVLLQDESFPESQTYLLLDFLTLLLAQSQIMAVSSYEIEQSRQQLAEERQRVKDYSQLLERQKVLIQERNRLLERQQVELIQQAQRADQLKQRFTQIAQILSLEGKTVFQEIVMGVNVSSRSTNQIVDISQLLTTELEPIHGTSKLVERLGQQLRQLAVQVTIVANQAGSELLGFSHITNEINKLVAQTEEIGRQIDRMVARFQLRVQELTESALTGMTVIRSLSDQIQQAEVTFTDLDTIVHQQAASSGGPPAAPPDTVNELLSLSAEQLNALPEGTRALVQKISLAEATLTELKALLRQEEYGPLIQKIRRAMAANPRLGPR